jgi:predicted nucleotidyltransferase
MSNPTIIELPDRVRDRDIFRDHQGRMFVTLGYIQPTDRVLSFLKYIPDETGKWQAGGIRYKRLFWGSVDSTVEGMASLPQNYTIFDSHFQTDLVEPPRTTIKEYFSSEQRLTEILAEPKDELEEIVRKAAETLRDELKLPLGNLGISGSILWKGHNPSFSDINMNIYGFKESWLLQENYPNLENKENQIRIRSLPEWNHGIERVQKRVPSLEKSDLQTLFSRRKALCIKDRCIGITPILNPEEAPIDHGSESYTTLTQNPVKVSMVVENADYGIFHPAIYTTEPTVIEGCSVTRIMIYDGAFCGLIKKGDRIEVSGTLQRVSLTNSDAEFHQIMIGTKSGSGKEYVKILS